MEKIYSSAKLLYEAENVARAMETSQKHFIKNLAKKIRVALSAFDDRSNFMDVISLKEHFDALWPCLWDFYALDLEPDGWTWNKGEIVPPTDNN